MNIFMNEYYGFCFELNHFWARLNEKMNFQNVSPRAISALAPTKPSSSAVCPPEPKTNDVRTFDNTALLFSEIVPQFKMSTNLARRGRREKLAK